MRDGSASLSVQVGTALEGPAQDWGSGCDRHWRGWIVCGLEFLSKGGTERAIIDGATNLQQEIGAASRPSHLLRFVHSAVHQEIGGPFGDRGSNAQSGTMALGVIDQPVALAGEITIQRCKAVHNFREGAMDFRLPGSPWK